MEAVGQLTGGVAHDFNNLLMVVQGNLEALSTRIPDDNPLRRYVDRAILGAARGALLTQQLLAFARRQRLLPTVFNVTARIAGLAELLRGTVGHSVVLDLSPTEDLWPVEADPNQLEAALLNLAINARDAMLDGGRLRIETANATLDAFAAAADGGIETGTTSASRS